MQAISPCLWFDGQAEAAANFYVSVFKNSRIIQTSHFPEGGPAPAGSVMTVQFLLDGQEFLALNGGPQFQFSPAVSLMVHCQTQDEIDDYWAKLSEGGQEVACGWVTDKFGLSWQVLPAILPTLLSGTNPAATQRAFTAMVSMTKLNIALLEKAYKGA